MVTKSKSESKYGQREAKIKVRENPLSELPAKPGKTEWISDESMRKSEHLTGAEESK